MENLRNKIIALRDGLQLTVSADDNIEIIFQNTIFRPILKNQNDILIEVLRNYIKKHKIEFELMNVDKKLKFIELTIQKDIKLRNFLKGMIIGWFTVEEYLEYTNNSSNLNKRMMNLLINRYQSQIQIIWLVFCI